LNRERRAKPSAVYDASVSMSSCPNGSLLRWWWWWRW